MASLSSSYLFDPPSVTAINRGLVNSNAFDPAPSLFSSNVNPASINPRALPEPLNSVQAAIPFIPGLKMSGGSKRKRSRIHKKRINNISKNETTQKVEYLIQFLRYLAKKWLFFSLFYCSLYI